MNANIQVTKKDEFNVVYTKVVERKEFAKGLEEIYNKHYKTSYVQDGFREGTVPYNLAITNDKLADSILKTVALVDRQIFVEEIIKEVEGSIYDIKDGEEQTDFAEFDLESEDPVIFQLEVELASFVDKVDYENIKVDEALIKTKKPTEKELDTLFTEYKKVKDPQNKATKTSYVEVEITDGKDTEKITFNLNEKFDEEKEPLKAQTHKEIQDLVIGKTVGDEFDYALLGADKSKLDVKAKIVDIYRVKTLDDAEFVELLKEGEVPADQKEDLTIEKVRQLFEAHVMEINNNNREEEIRSLTFAALKDVTEGIHFNEREVENLKNQFLGQVNKMAEKEGKTIPDYVVENFGGFELMNDYIEMSQKARVLQAAVYRQIGKQMGATPTYMQLEGFVKAFLFKVDPNQQIPDDLALQINQQVTTVLAEPLNRQRIVESWMSVRAEDKINEMVGLLQ